MGLKLNSISELKKKLAESLKVLEKGRGVQKKLKRAIDRVSKQDNDVKKNESNDSHKSNGMEMYGGSTSVKRKQNREQSSKREVKVEDENSLKRDLPPETRSKKLEDERSLKNLVNPEGNLFQHRI